MRERLNQTEHRLYPQYLGPADFPLVDDLRDEYSRNVGKTFRELQTSLRERGMAAQSKTAKSALIQRVLDQVFLPKTPLTNPDPSALRQSTFRRAHEIKNLRGSAFFRNQVLNSIAKAHKMTIPQINHRFFADIDEEASIQDPQEHMSNQEITLRCNLSLVQSLLLKSEFLTIKANGQILPLIRHAKWMGLICVVKETKGPFLTVMEISGPLSIIQKTRLYGRSLGELIGYLPALKHFAVDASIMINEQTKILEIRPHDPIFPSHSPKHFDSKIEEKFFKQFQRATENWDLIREAKPLKSKDRFIFPDFVIQNRTVQNISWHLEIVGFWTPDYILDKIISYKSIGLDSVILCVCEKYQFEKFTFPQNVHLVPFKTRIDPKAVLAILDSRSS